MRKTTMGAAGAMLLVLAACAAPVDDSGWIEELPFAGNWNCDGGRVTIAGMVYADELLRQRAEILTVDDTTRGFLMTLSDGSRIEVTGLTDARMTLIEPAKQRQLNCARL